MRTFCFDVISIPQIIFAHEYSTDKHDIEFGVWENIIELSYVISGDLFLNYGKGVEIVPEGSVLIGRRSEPEHIFSKGKHSHITVGFLIDTRSGNDLILPNWLVPSNGSVYLSNFRDIVEEYSLKQKNTLKLSAMVLSLLADIDSEYKKQQNKSSVNYGAQKYSKKAKRYIINHISEQIYIEDIASAVGLSVGYLSNIFKKTTGQTLVEYINTVKLQRVRELRLTLGVTLKEAGKTVGFYDENYLSRLYKKYFGKNLSEIPKHNIRDKTE